MLKDTNLCSTQRNSAAPKRRLGHMAGPSWKSLLKAGICFLSYYAGMAQAQSNPFAGGTLVPGTGTRGGPLPLAPALAPALLPNQSSLAPAPSMYGTSTSAGGRGIGGIRSMTSLPARPANLTAYLESLPKKDSALVDGALRVNVEGGGRKLRAGSGTGQLISMPMYGCPSTDYSAQVTVGGQDLYAIIDSGSTTFGVASNECSECNLSIGYQLSSEATNLEETIEADYGSGAWLGVEIEDTVALGEGPAVSIVFGDILKQQQFFQPNNCVYGSEEPANNQAIMGIGPNDLLQGDTESYIASVLPELRYPAFAFSPCELGGTLYLGGYSTDAVDAAPFYTPMVNSDASPFVAVGMLAMDVGGVDLGARLDDFGYSVVDTGTSGLVFPTPVYDAIVNRVAKATNNALSAQYFAGSDCLRLAANASASTINNAAPPLTFYFYNSSGGKASSLTVPASHSYLSLKYDKSGSAYVCPLLIDAGKEPQTIIGNTAMQENTVIFDIQNGQVGFAPSASACS